MGSALLLLAIVAAAFGSVLIIGSAILVWLRPATDPALFALAPAIGIGVSGAILTTALHLGSARTAGVTTLGIVLVISITAIVLPAHSTWKATSPRPRGFGREIALAGVACTPMALAALVPVLASRTVGPVALLHADSWNWYAPIDHVLQRTGLRAGEPNPLWPTDRSDVVLGLLPNGVRIGFDSLNATLASALGLPADATLTALTIVIGIAFAAAVYGLARLAADLAPSWSVCAAWIASGSIVLVPVFETAGPSITAYALVPIAWWALIKATTYPAAPIGRWHVLAALAAVGVIATYVEALPLLLLGGILIVAVQLAGLRGRPHAMQVAGRLALAATLIGALALALSPVTAARAIRYQLSTLGALDLAAQPDWGIGIANLPPWLSGLSSLYEARLFAAEPDWSRLVAYVLSGLVAGIAIWGIVKANRGTRILLLTGSVTVAALGVWLYVGEDCLYCWYRNWVFAAPIIALATAAGMSSIMGWAGRVSWLPGRAALVAVVALPLVGALYAAVRTSEAAFGARLMTTASYRDLPRTLEGQPPGAVLIEGAPAGYTLTGWFWASSAVQLVAEAGRRSVFDAATGSFIGGSNARGRQSPDYRYVLTRFSGVHSNRQPLAAATPFKLMRRAPVDVSLNPGGWAVNEGARGVDAIPWLLGPFDLTVAAPRSGRVRVVMEFRGSQAAGLTPRASMADGSVVSVRTRQLGEGRVRWCAEVEVPRSRLATLRVTPSTGFLGGYPPYAQPHQETPRLPDLLGLTTLVGERAGSPGTC